MLKRFWMSMLLASAAMAPVAALGTIPSYDKLYVFGDSYCDVGNIAIATKGTIPGPLYFNGQFSNGPIWVEHVAGFLRLPLKPELAPGGGTDYAFGGALVTAPLTTPDGTVPSVPEQVELYLSQHDYKADPNALYIIEGGGNDILAANGGSADALGLKIGAGLAGSELLLRHAGARHFLIPNLFNVGLLPAGQAKADFALQATDAANKTLNELLPLEMLLEDVHILRLDVFSLLHSIKVDPAHFGFTNITTPCLVTAPCADPDHTFFWDEEHPTEFGHAFFAVTVENLLAQQP